MSTPVQQTSPYQSPWSFRTRIILAAWHFCWTIFCRWTPKPFNCWRLFILKLFGASIEGTPFVHQRAKIQIPWNLILKHRSCLGDGANAYSLGKILLGKGCTVAQEVYLCSGTHDFSDPNLPLVVGNITIEQNAFIGVRAILLPNVTIGKSAVVGAGSVVTKDIDAGAVVAGNPARNINKGKKKDA